MKITDKMIEDIINSIPKKEIPQSGKIQMIKNNLKQKGYEVEEGKTAKEIVMEYIEKQIEEENCNIYVLKEIYHNISMIEELKQKGYEVEKEKTAKEETLNYCDEMINHNWKRLLYEYSIDYNIAYITQILKNIKQKIQEIQEN